MDRDEGRETDSSPPDELVERVSEGRRQLLKVLLGGMAAYSVPLMASFSMEGLRFGTAQAGGPQFCPPGLAGRRRAASGTAVHFEQPDRRRPAAWASVQRSEFNPPGRPFNAEPGDCFPLTSNSPSTVTELPPCPAHSGVRGMAGGRGKPAPAALSLGRRADERTPCSRPP